jgi:hypothetical protein
MAHYKHRTTEECLHRCSSKKVVILLTNSTCMAHHYLPMARIIPIPKVRLPCPTSRCRWSMLPCTLRWRRRARICEQGAQFICPAAICFNHNAVAHRRPVVSTSERIVVWLS